MEILFDKMEARANYIIIKEDGTQQIYVDLYGAETFNDIFLMNLNELTDYIENKNKTDWLYESSYCEAGILLNYQKKEIIFFGVNIELPKSAITRELIPYLEKKWDNWKVSLAIHDIVSLAKEIDYNLKEVESERSEDFFQFEEKYLNEILEKSHKNLPYQPLREYIFTIKLENIIKDYRVNSNWSIFLTFTSFLSRGEKIIELLTQLEEFKQLPDEMMITSGAYFDYDAKKLYYWDSWALEEQNHKKIEGFWPGWEVIQHFAGYPHHLQITGRNNDNLLISHDKAINLIESELGLKFNP